MGLKENLLGNLNHDPKAKAVSYWACAAMPGFGATPGPAFEKGPAGGGYDGFGVMWLAPSSGGGAPVPDVNHIVLEDIADWREKVTIPDIDALDWDEIAAIEWKGVESYGGYDAKKQLLDFGMGNGVFERLAALMGFEEALIAMVEDPEECEAFFDAITDYKIAYLKKVKEYFHPDVITYYDDICTQRSPLMSPDTYRELIKPQHKRFVDTCKAEGIIPIYHCCGYAQDLVPDFIDCGWDAWSSVQPCNDIAMLCRTYGDKICFIGGYDTNGKPGSADATKQEKKAEVKRCFKEYGKLPGYVFIGFLLADTLDPKAFMDNMMPMIVESVVQSYLPRGKEKAA